jgi:hypothetical protein
MEERDGFGSPCASASDDGVEDICHMLPCRGSPCLEPQPLTPNPRLEALKHYWGTRAKRSAARGQFLACFVVRAAPFALLTLKLSP